MRARTLSPDLLARLRMHADSWEREGAVPADALDARDPMSEASILREAIDALELISDWAKEDTIGFTIVGWVANSVFDDHEADAFVDGFRAFYDPARWLGSHRAAAEYIARHWRADRNAARISSAQSD